MNPVSLEYLVGLKDIHTWRSGKITITPLSERDPAAAETTQSTLSHYIQATFGEDRREEILAHSYDLDYWLAQLEQGLYQDLENYCTAQELAVLRQAAVAYLPIRNANGFCGHVPHAKECHVIGVHLPLIWVSFLLTQALLLAAENQGEQARKTYQIVLAGHRKDNFRASFQEWLESPPDIENTWLESEAGAVSSVILRFVGLHELGHLALGHVDQAGICYAAESNEVSYQHSATLGQTAVWAMEYAADRFAVDHMLAHTGGAEQMWNNLLFIGAFFRFIEHLEIIRGAPLSQDHPPPRQRLHALSRRVTEVLGPPPNDAQAWAESLLLEWRE
jgi:hypothetical protein